MDVAQEELKRQATSYYDCTFTRAPRKNKKNERYWKFPRTTYPRNRDAILPDLYSIIKFPVWNN
jgi:hypothetical protein